jgi:anaerobic selenocysteine-containing dehydrogenase
LPSVSLRQPIIKPLGESIPTHDILIELAKRIDDGMEKYFDFGTIQNFIEASIARIEGLQKAGGLNYLKANGVWIDANAPVIYKSYEKGGFNTPSRKFEVYSRRMENAGFSALPVYEQPPGSKDLGPVVSTVREQTPGAQDAGQDTFTMVTFQSSVHTDTTTAVSIWLNEIAHDNPLWINAEVAKERGIKKGDTLVVTSPLGAVKVKAWPTQGIHPNVVAIGGNGGHWEYSRVARGERFDSQEPNTKLIWWGKKAHGAHVQQIVPTTPDPIGGGQAWSDTTVTISKE